MDTYPMLSEEEQALLYRVFADFGQIVPEYIDQQEYICPQYSVSENVNCSIDPMVMLERLLNGMSDYVPHVLDNHAPFGMDMTTLMMRNVPRRCTQRMLMSDIVLTGYGNLVDFVYLPTDISTGRNLGYAFLNFMKPESAESFRQTFHKKHLNSIRGSRAGLSVSFAIIQGLEANLDNVLKTAAVHRIRNPEYLPLIRDSEGRLVPCNLGAVPKHRTPPSMFNKGASMVLSAH